MPARNCDWCGVRPIELAAGRSVSAMMQKAPHFQAAYDLGGDIAEADRWDQPRPFPKVPSAGELWARIMGDESRADWPANTLPQLRHELERGYADFW